MAGKRLLDQFLEIESFIFGRTRMRCIEGLGKHVLQLGDIRLFCLREVRCC